MCLASVPTKGGGHESCVYLFGGLSDDTTGSLNDMWRYHVETRVWERLPPPGEGSQPPPAAFGRGHTLLRDGRSWFFYGGIGGEDSHIQNCDVYDIWSNTWTSLAHLRLRPLWGHSVSSVLLPISGACNRGPMHEEVLIVIGGMEGEVCNDKIFVIHTGSGDTSSWHCEIRPFSNCIVTTGNLNCRGEFPLRRRHGACVYRDVFILVAGGRNQFSFLNDLWAYNVQADRWVPLVAGISPALVRTFFSNPHSTEPAAHIIGFVQNIYSRVRDPPYHNFSTMHPRTGLTMFIQGDLVYTFGGFFWSWQDSCSFSDMHVYDITHHRWQGVSEVNDTGVVSDSALRPRPTTMAAICPLPQHFDTLPDVTTGSLVSRWFLFGGRYGNVPTRRAYTLTVRAPAYRLTHVAGRWLRDLPSVPLSEAKNFVIRGLAQIRDPPFETALFTRWGRDADAGAGAGAGAEDDEPAEERTDVDEDDPGQVEPVHQNGLDWPADDNELDM